MDAAQFIADQADKRKIVVLGETPPVDYAAGQHSMSFSVRGDAPRLPRGASSCSTVPRAAQVPEVNVSHLKRHVLANVGLLIAGLFSGEDEIVQVRSVSTDGIATLSLHGHLVPPRNDDPS